MTRNLEYSTRICLGFMALAVGLGLGACSVRDDRVAVDDQAAAEIAVPARMERNPTLPDLFIKREVSIPMRDGVNLFTAIYEPADTSQTYPILMLRTPYSVGPYGADEFPRRLGPSRFLAKAGYIFVYQDVRGTFMSEGQFVNMTPHLDNKSSTSDIDESTDTYDTVEWLINNVPNNNGKVGQWGISYPGFYAAAGVIDAHPALKAVSPQAPIADWFFDDFHHHGAFFLPHSFNFMSSFALERTELTTEWPGSRFDHGTPDGYKFFLEMGPIKNSLGLYSDEARPYWDDILAHPNYDSFWQASNLIPHLNNVGPAVMTVGGWFDAEDLYGPLNIYQSIEEKNPDAFNMLVMGPWVHGGWARNKGDRLGDARFGDGHSRWYQKNIEFPFFEHFLRGESDLDLPEAYAFDTGANQWHRFEEWPPARSEAKELFLQENGGMTFAEPSAEEEAYDEYISDPAKPVPFIQDITTRMPKHYMTADQRFAARRPDVLAYETDVLEEDITLAGPILAGLWVSTSGTASDWIVKLIDVYPPDAHDNEDMDPGVHMGDYQMMIRSEVIRGRFRNSYEHPEPFVPDEPTKVELKLQDVLHTFKAGHRIMVQIQSSWFPLVDRNPQKYVDNIYMADEKDFIKATQRVYRSASHPTSLRIGVLEPN